MTVLPAVMAWPSLVVRFIINKGILSVFLYFYQTIHFPVTLTNNQTKSLLRAFLNLLPLDFTQYSCVIYPRF